MNIGMTKVSVQLEIPEPLLLWLEALGKPFVDQMERMSPLAPDRESIVTAFKRLTNQDARFQYWRLEGTKHSPEANANFELSSRQGTRFRSLAIDLYNICRW